MTEDEARTKWCPFVRVTMVNDLVTANRSSATGSARDECRCIASECMAWRRMLVVAAHPLVEDPPEDAEKRVVRHGFCGLAGREGSP